MSCKDISLDSCEKKNPGKTYKEYLFDYKKKVAESHRILMEKAKITINEVRRCRRENGYIDFNDDSFYD